MTKLRLIANSQDDLPLIASAVQDAILNMRGIRFDRKARYVSFRLSRYRHEAETPSRVEAGLRIDGVISVQSKGVDKTNPEAMTVLLDVTAEMIDKVAAVLTLIFAGGGAMRIEVEAIDVTLADIGEPRKTKSIPSHNS